MTHVQSQMVSQLRQLIFYHLDNDFVSDANFLAGRLHAMDHRNADSLHLLSLTYLRIRRYKSAYDYAHKYGGSGRNLGCAYVFALACEALGKYHEGVSALEKARPLWTGRSSWNKHSETTRRHLPDAVAILNLLGRLWRGYGDTRRAAECLTEAHKAGPLTWSAFQTLCDLGTGMNAANAFQLTSEMAAQTTSAPMSLPEDFKEPPMPVNPTVNGHRSLATPSQDSLSGSGKGSSDWGFQLPKIVAKTMFGSPPKLNAQVSWETPTTNGANGDEDVEMGGVNQDTNTAYYDAPPAAPLRKSKTLSRLGLDSSKDSGRMHAPQLKILGGAHSDTADGEDVASMANRSAPVHKRTHSGHVSAATSDSSTAAPRRSNRLFGQLGSSRSTTRSLEQASSIAVKRDAELKKTKPVATKGRGTSTVGRVVSGNRKVMPPSLDSKESRAPSRNSVNVPSLPAGKPSNQTVILPDTAAVESLLGLFRRLGCGYEALSRYDYRASVRAFESLPAAQRETPWVMAQIGKAYYEASEYTKAETYYARMMKLEPSRVEDTEFYSTVLWQLRKPVQLSFLAHSLKELDFDAPQTWCAVGNAFSLNREHDQAIACFKRATQIDLNFYYAHTLTGHELLTNEEYDSALVAYRKGVGAEKRGYASWYGIGKCYERMGKLEEAERHYRIAASINKHNSVICVCIGAILERQRHPREALIQFTNAVGLNPQSVLARFRRARSLMSLHAFQDAMQELNELLVISPEEANVWYMLGKSHKAMGDRSEAVRCFTAALNLDAKSAAHIKEALEAIDDSDPEDESEM